MRRVLKNRTKHRKAPSNIAHKTYRLKPFRISIFLFDNPHGACYSVQNVRQDISTFISVEAVIVGMIVGGIDFIMSLLELFLDFIILFPDWFSGRRKNRIQTAKEEGRKKGYAEGDAAAKAENGDAVEESSNSPSNPSKKS